jgi:hypothetical protein
MDASERLIRISTLAQAVRKCYSEEIKMNMIECFLISIDQICKYEDRLLWEIRANLDTDDRLAKEILGIK